MSSKNIEMKTISGTQQVTETTQHDVSQSNPTNTTQTYDVKEEINPKIRYLMSYYGY